MKQTAVEWLEEQFTKGEIDWTHFFDAKEMEKQQIINSYIEGNYKSNMDMYWKKEAANKYYCKLYKK